MPQKNLRLPTATLEPLAELAAAYSTEATVVAVAVQGLYDKFQEYGAEALMDAVDDSLIANVTNISE